MICIEVPNGYSNYLKLNKKYKCDTLTEDQVIVYCEESFMLNFNTKYFIDIKTYRKNKLQRILKK